MERKQQESKPNWEMVDPKPPVVQCGHLEKQKAHETHPPGFLTGVDTGAQ